MPFVLHPSGYCVWFNTGSANNLISGAPCPVCGRVAGHSPSCKYFKENDEPGTSSRPKLYNATSILWAQSPKVYFITFTLPSREGEKTYQVSARDKETGDLAVAAKFSKMMEAIAVKIKRDSPPNGIKRFSYVWTSEAQMKRQAKFGGIGDLHYHLVTNRFIDIKWLTATWAGYFGSDVLNAVHIEHIPRNINSIPAYLAKYLGKGSGRRIYARRFGCSRDLSGLAPVQMNSLPASIQPITSKITVHPNGYESCTYFFRTEDILKRFGRVMQAETEFQGTRAGRNFTPGAIESRRFVREIKQNQQRHARETGTIDFPGALGSSYST